MNNTLPIFSLQSIADWFDVPAADVEIAFWTILVGIVVNASCAILGCYLVLRRMSLLGDAISHGILPGLAIAFFMTGILGRPPDDFALFFLGALALGILTAFLTETLRSYGNVAEDSSMGVVFTSLFALGVVLISQIERVHLDADCVLYGLIQFVALDTVEIRWLGLHVPRVLGTTLPVLLLTVLFVTVFWKELKISSFDAKLATAMGINAGLMHYLLMGMVAAVTVAAFEAVGSIVVIAMLIVPGATAHLLTDRLGWMMVWSVVVGTIAATVGYVLAARWSTSAAGMMATVAGAQLTLAVLFAPRHGLLSKAIHNVRLSLRIVAEDIVATLYRREEQQGHPVAVARRESVRLAGGSLLAWLAVPLLKRQGRVAGVGRGTLRLTAAGRRFGQSLVRSHRLWESYLSENFDLPPDHLHEPAERIEHYIGPNLQEQLAEELQLPDTDPHGAAIPPSESPEE